MIPYLLYYGKILRILNFKIQYRLPGFIMSSHIFVDSKGSNKSKINLRD